jgi:hypothetical protein
VGFEVGMCNESQFYSGILSPCNFNVLLEVAGHFIGPFVPTPVLGFYV